MTDDKANAEEARRRKQLEELLRLCAEHSWNNGNDNFRHRRQFEDVGIKSAEELRKVLERAAQDSASRSFERQPNPDRQQTEPSLIIQAKIQDEKGKQRQLTIVLNPDRDENGKQHGGTAYLNDRNRLDIHRYIDEEKKRGFDSKLHARGNDLARSDENAPVTPGQRIQGEEWRQKIEEYMRQLRKREDREERERENYRGL